MSNVAIILGAGNGTRMKSEKSKLLLEIGSKTVIERSVEAFLSVSDIDEIIVVARAQDIDIYSELLTDERISFVIGGATRQQSVKNAVETVDDAHLIIIHDGARPLVTPQVIDSTVCAAETYGAAAPAIAVHDTIKVAVDGIVKETPDRRTLFAVQTPQVFFLEHIQTALAEALSCGIALTDDCSAAEAAGMQVYLTQGSEENRKITVPTDLILAEAILKGRETS